MPYVFLGLKSSTVQLLRRQRKDSDMIILEDILLDNLFGSELKG